MALDPKAFEKLGSFYLGRPVGDDEAQPTPFLYDSSDLTTHAICVGMTGSGKTGLGISLLEEAAIDGIPALIIDPKGDLTNLALQFPELRPDDFLPWVSDDEASRADLSREAFAAKQAELWRTGLARWGEDGERIRLLKESAEVAVYTPGSTAGLPLSVVSSFDAPPAAIREDHELFADQIETSVAGLFALMGLSADPSRSREGTLLGAILHDAWGRGESLSLEEIARRIQQPPITRLGVMELEAFFPAKDRFALVLALNNLIASPGFAIWRQGEPLDIRRLLTTPEGKPRLAVLSIAHLSDSERMFFVTLLLAATLSWMRQQKGTGSLRALLYMDEVFGYFPPTANPPSKKPLLTLMKQARAFGLGVVLATQNPADLDYKGLANAGTWFIGRLQTERDKLRLLDGLAGLGVDRARIDAMLGRLGKRVFLINNVHENEPRLFETRWALSYLCGPLTREQIRRLPRPASAPAAVSPLPATPAPTPQPPAQNQEAAAPSAPPLLSGIRQIFPKQLPAHGRLSPALVGLASLRYRDAKAGLDFSRDVALAAPFPDGLNGVDWDEAEPITPADFAEEAPRLAGIEWDSLPADAARPAAYKTWERPYLTWLVEHQRLSLLACPEVKLISEPEESEGEFRARIAHHLREERDARVKKLRERYASEAEKLERRLQSAQEAVRRREATANQHRWQGLLSVGTAILTFLTSGKKVSSTNVSKASTAMRSIGRTTQSGGDLGAARERLEETEAAVNELKTRLDQEIAEITNQLDSKNITLEAKELRPTRTGSRVQWLALGWLGV